MARSRLLKHGFFLDDHLCELPALTRLLFAGLWTLADREGRLADRPKRIKAEVLPHDKANIGQMLDMLHEAGFICRYEVNEKALIHVTTFLQHQKPHHKEPPSMLQPCPVHELSTGQAPVMQIVSCPPEAEAETETEAESETVAEAERPLLPAYRALEDLVGTLPVTVQQELFADLEDTPVEWVVEACKEAAANNGRSWRYVQAILRRWRKDGFKSEKPHAAPTRSGQGHSTTTGRSGAVRRTSDFD